MAMQPPLKKALNIIGLIAIIAVGWFGVKKYQSRPRAVQASMDIKDVVLPDAPEASLVSSNAVKLSLPSTDLSANGGTQITWYQMAWNSQLATHYANGGAKTTKGSLYDKYKLQITIKREDNCDKSIAALIAFGEEVKNRGTDIPGVFCSYMGDGMANFFAILDSKLSKLGLEYTAVNPGLTVGKSDGEDQLMAPLEWKKNPKNAIGKSVACYLRDGDMNILLKWAADNDIKVNPDETTYDENAINLIASSDYLDAANKYIVGYIDTKRKIVKDGKTTGKTIDLPVDAVATWTPGDVNIAREKGGLVTIASTKQYSTQMPNITITIKKWAEAHREDIENIITASAQAGDQVRSYEDVKLFSAGLSAKVWDFQNANYWLTYYNGKEEKDKQGLKVSLGGSKVFNLADMADNYGLGKDGLDRYKIVYTSFGDILSGMYPELMPKYPKYETVVDKSYLQAVIDKHPELMEGKSLTSSVKYSDDIVDEVSNKAYSIEFEVNSASIKSESISLLNEIFKSAVVAEKLTLGVYGHTDNTGNAEINQPLSEQRAEAIKKYLINKGVSPNRVITKGYGSSHPVDGVDVNSAAGRKKNRRVEIVLGE